MSKQVGVPLRYSEAIEDTLTLWAMGDIRKVCSMLVSSVWLPAVGKFLLQTRRGGNRSWSCGRGDGKEVNCPLKEKLMRVGAGPVCIKDEEKLEKQSGEHTVHVCLLHALSIQWWSRYHRLV